VLHERQTRTTIAADRSATRRTCAEIRRLSGLLPGELRSYLASITDRAIVDR
jgi:hypothetical protein